MKKIAVFIMFCLSIIFLVSCSANDAENISSGSEEMSLAPENESLNELEEIENFTDSREKILDIVVPDLLMLDELTLKAVNKYLYDMGTDYKLNFIDLNYDNYNEELFGKLDSGEKIDLYFNWDSQRDETQIAEHAYVLNEYLESDNGEALKSSLPEYVWEELKFEENIYGVQSYYHVSTSPAYMVNISIMEKYGCTEEDFKVPFDELHDLMYEVYEKEQIRPIVKEHYYGINNKFFKYGNHFFIDRESKEVSYFLDLEENMKLFEAVYNYAQDGLMVSSTYEQPNITHWFIAYLEYFDPTLEMHRPHLLDENGEFAKNEEDYLIIPISEHVYLDYPIGNGMSVSKSGEYVDESLDFLTKLMSDKGLIDLISYGVEGAHYTMSDDGRIFPISGEMDPIYKGIYFSGQSATITNRYLSTPTIYEMENKSEILMEFEQKAVKGSFYDLDISNLIDKTVTENVNEKSKEVLSEISKAFYGENWEIAYNLQIEQMDSINHEFQGTDFIASYVGQVVEEYQSLEYQEIIELIRNGLDTVGGREVIAEIERILSE